MSVCVFVRCTLSLVACVCNGHKWYCVTDLTLFPVFIFIFPSSPVFSKPTHAAPCTSGPLFPTAAEQASFPLSHQSFLYAQSNDAKNTFLKDPVLYPLERVTPWRPCTQRKHTEREGREVSSVGLFSAIVFSLTRKVALLALCPLLCH